MAYRRLRDVRVIAGEIDEAIDEFKRGRGATGRFGRVRRWRSVGAYLDRVCALLAEDLPHSAPAALDPELRRN